MGIEVGMEDGLVKVVFLIEDMLVYCVGVKVGDLIFKLDEMLIKGLILNDVVKKMCGKLKMLIKLIILCKGEVKLLEIMLICEVIKV